MKTQILFCTPCEKSKKAIQIALPCSKILNKCGTVPNLHFHGDTLSVKKGTIIHICPMCRANWQIVFLIGRFFAEIVY